MGFTGDDLALDRRRSSGTTCCCRTPPPAATSDDPVTIDDRARRGGRTRSTCSSCCTRWRRRRGGDRPGGLERLEGRADRRPGAPRPGRDGRGAARRPSPPLDDERRELAEAGELAVLVRDGEVIIAAPDAAGTLYRTAGVLALHSLDVREASIRTHAGMAVNRFVVDAAVRPDARPGARPQRPRPGAEGRARAGREAGREGARLLPPRTGRAPRRRPSIHWFDESADATVVEFRGEDEIGLLCRITAALEQAGLDVRSARVSSVAGAVVDAFYVTDARRQADPGVPAAWRQAPRRPGRPRQSCRPHRLWPVRADNSGESCVTWRRAETSAVRRNLPVT